MFTSQKMYRHKEAYNHKIFLSNMNVAFANYTNIWHFLHQKSALRPPWYGNISEYQQNNYHDESTITFHRKYTSSWFKGWQYPRTKWKNIAGNIIENFKIRSKTVIKGGKMELGFQLRTESKPDIWWSWALPHCTQVLLFWTTTKPPVWRSH